MRRIAVSIEDRSAHRHTLRPVVERGPTELQQLQKRTSHDKLLEAGRQSFAELTYAGTTIDHIVSRALEFAGFDWPDQKRWGESAANGARKPRRRS